MKNEEFVELVEELIKVGHEFRGVECKGPGVRTDKNFFTKVVRACIGMANRRDGGTIIIGLSENDNNSFDPVGLNASELATWSYDNVADLLAVYCDPNIQFEIVIKKYRENDFVLIIVNEFEDIPIICNKDYENNLRKGACYVRSRRKPETAEIPSQTEMRDLLDLATEKRIRNLSSLFNAIAPEATISRSQEDSELFDNQINEFI